MKWKSRRDASQPKPGRDAWDKFDIVGRLFQAVIVGVLAIVIPLLLQKQQHEATQAISTAQLQLERDRLLAEKRSQDAELLRLVLSELAAPEPKRRQLAIAAFDRVVPESVHSAVMLTLVDEDQDPAVKLSALKKLERSADREVAVKLAELAKREASQPWKDSLSKVAANIGWSADLPFGSCLISNEGPPRLSFIRAEGSGGGRAVVGPLFRDALDLNNNARRAVGVTTVSDAFDYIVQRMPGRTGDSSFFRCNGGPFTASISDSSIKKFAVVIGIGEYPPMHVGHNLNDAELRNEAKAVAAFFRSLPGTSVFEAYDGDANEAWVRSRLENLAGMVGANDLVFIYFGGGGVSDRNLQLFPLLSTMPRTGAYGALRLHEIKRALAAINSRAEFVMLDTIGASSTQYQDLAYDFMLPTW